MLLEEQQNVKLNDEIIALSFIVALVCIFISRNYFDDKSVSQVIIVMYTAFTFLIITGVIQKNVNNIKKYDGINNIIFGAVFITILSYIFIHADDVFRMIVSMIIVIPIYNILLGFYKIFKNLINSNNNSLVKSIILMIFQIASFVLTIIKLIEIFKDNI